MESKQLDNLVRTGSLKHEPVIQAEYDGLVVSGRKRLTDAGNESLAFESRFDLAYNGAFSLALAALRWHGFRPENRYVVFQVLPLTLNLGLRSGEPLPSATGEGTQQSMKAFWRLTGNF